MFHLRAAYVPQIVAKMPHGVVAGLCGTCGEPANTNAVLRVGWAPDPNTYDLHHANASRFGARKELLLLEDHLSHEKCPECIYKHLDRAIAFMEEARSLDEGDPKDSALAYQLSALSPGIGDASNDVRVIRREIGLMLGRGGKAQRRDVASTAGVRVGASAETIRQANAAILRRHPGIDDNTRHIMLGIGILETGFGVTGSWLKSDGTPSYNWGGLMGSGTAGFITHGDVNPDGTPIEPTPHFKAFNNMDDAVDAFYATWSHGDVPGIGRPEVAHEETVLPGATRGDARAVATTMYAHYYYGGISTDAQESIDAYASAIVGGASTAASALGETNNVVDHGGSIGGDDADSGTSWWQYAFLGIAAAGVGIFAFAR